MVNLTNFSLTIPQQETITALTCNEFYINEYTTQIITSLLIGLILVALYWYEKPFKEYTKQERIIKLVVIAVYISYALVTVKQLT